VGWLIGRYAKLALENPAATRVLERFGIDYCCGGNQLLEQACAKAGVTVDDVLDSLEIDEETALAARQVHDWQSEPLSNLVANIKNTHHKYTREEIMRLSALLEKVCAVHGKNHPELYEIQSTFSVWQLGSATALTAGLRLPFPLVPPSCFYFDRIPRRSSARILVPSFNLRKIRPSSSSSCAGHSSAGKLAFQAFRYCSLCRR
jgi:hypothetical protein